MRYRITVMRFLVSFMIYYYFFVKQYIGKSGICPIFNTQFSFQTFVIIIFVLFVRLTH